MTPRTTRRVARQARTLPLDAVWDIKGHLQQVSLCARIAPGFQHGNGKGGTYGMSDWLPFADAIVADEEEVKGRQPAMEAAPRVSQLRVFTPNFSPSLLSSAAESPEIPARSAKIRGEIAVHP